MVEKRLNMMAIVQHPRKVLRCKHIYLALLQKPVPTGSPDQTVASLKGNDANDTKVCHVATPPRKNARPLPGHSPSDDGEGGWTAPLPVRGHLGQAIDETASVPASLQQASC